MSINYVGDGKVELISSPTRCYVDLAAKFTRTEETLDKIIASKENPDLVRKIIDCGHLAATEFDVYIFAVEGYSRVCEAQLIRKRLASYMIKSGRVDKHGKRSYDIVVPKNILDVSFDYCGETIDTYEVLNILECWYANGVMQGFPEEDLRYMKPQATEFKALIAMDAHALIDWFKIRCCMNAQAEIRDMACKMLKLCKEDNPVLFEKAGPNCVSLGYCPENSFQNKSCSVIKKNDAIKILDVVKKAGIKSAEELLEVM